MNEPSTLTRKIPYGLSVNLRMYWSIAKRAGAPTAAPETDTGGEVENTKLHALTTDLQDRLRTLYAQ